MKYLTVICLIFIGACKSGDRPPELNYSITLQLHSSAPTLDISLNFRRPTESTSTFVVLPSTWAGSANLRASIKNLKVSEPAWFVPTTQANQILVYHGRGEQVKLRYQFEPTASMTDDQSFIPVKLDEHSLHLIGSAFLLIPFFGTATEVPVEFEWHLPEQWKLASSHGVGTKVQTESAKLYELMETFFVGGPNLRIYETEIQGRAVNYAIQDRWIFSDEDYISQSSRIIETARDLFEDHEFPYFLVNLAGFQQARRAEVYEGVALTNGVSMRMSERADLKAQAGPLVSHECTHSWIGHKIVSAYSNKGTFAWFDEGFTEYFSWIVNVRSGLWTYHDYVEHFNQNMWDYHDSDVCSTPNSGIEQNFWSCKKTQRLPYLRGAMIARRWDNIMRNQSGTRLRLVDVMKKLIDFSEHGQKRIKTETVGATAREMVSHDFDADIQEYIEDGRVIRPGTRELGPCVNGAPYAFNAFGNPLPRIRFRADHDNWQKDHEGCLAWIN